MDTMTFTGTIKLYSKYLDCNYTIGYTVDCTVTPDAVTGITSGTITLEGRDREYWFSHTQLGRVEDMIFIDYNEIVDVETEIMEDCYRQWEVMQ